MTTNIAARGRFSKDPSAVLDYEVDWSQWMPANDEIDEIDWTVTGPDESLEILSGGRAPSVEGSLAKCWLGGGTIGGRYTLACRVTTSAGRIDERSLVINVVER